MRELTIHDLDTQLAEQLPARELMGAWKPHTKAPNQTAVGGDGGNNVPILSPQVNIGVNAFGNQFQSNNQSADGGDAYND
jgi:hypothetical protein